MATSGNRIVEAVKLINPDAQFSVIEEDIDKIEWHNGTTPIAKADIEARLTEADNLIEAEINKKASGKQKLLDLGLTEEEVKALIGI